MIRITTPRLELIAATSESLQCELEAPERLVEIIGARPACTWPPPLNDEHSMTWALKFCRQNPDSVGFGMWYFVLPLERLIIGNGGCKGKPNDGVVEIGYSLFPEYQGRGFATEAVRGLLGWIFARQEVHTVIAETLPELTGSIRVLERTGFSLLGDGSEPGVIRFGLKRSTFDSTSSFPRERLLQ